MNTLSKHEIKSCPRCSNPVECKPGDIVHCQCFGINLPDHVRNFIAAKYNDCLCINCLLQLSQPVHYHAELHSNFSKR